MSQRGPSSPLPSPRAHLAASLRLFDALADRSGGRDAFPGAARLRALLHRPRMLPASIPADQNGLKYDGYLTRSELGPAWGLACNDRWEGRALWGIAAQLAASLDGSYDLAGAIALRDALAQRGAPLGSPHRGPSLTLSVGFDAPGRPPRLKLYLQEPRWGEGACTVGDLRAVGRGLTGVTLPDGLPDEARVGVVTVGLRSDGTRALKLYLGGADATGLAARVGAWVPEAAAELAGLARILGGTSPSEPSFHYLTLRLGDGAPQVALNKIYEHERLGFGADPRALHEAWSEVRALFAAAGQDDGELSQLRAGLSGTTLVPTASAIERGGRSADVYVAAWPDDQPLGEANKRSD